MRKLFWLLSIPVLCCTLGFGQGGVIGPNGRIGPNGVILPGGGATPTLLAHCIAKGTGFCTINSTGATLITVEQITGGTGTLGPAPTENKSNTFQTPAATTCANSTNGVVQGYYIFNPTVGSGHIFTGGAASNAYYVSAWSNTPTTSGVYDTGSCASQAGGLGLTFATGSVTPASAGELVVSLAFDPDSSGGTWTVPASFALIDNCVSGCYSSSSTAYYIYPLTSALNPTWTDALNQNFVGNTMVFKHP